MKSVEELLVETKRPQCHRKEHEIFIHSVLHVLDREIPGCFVEIGTNKAKSSKCIFQILRAQGETRKVYGIDPTASAKEFWREAVHWHGGDLPAQLLDGYSQDPEIRAKVHEEIAWLFIDGCHCYECVIWDIDLWVPKMRPGGVVVFHDFNKGPNYMKKNHCPRLGGVRRWGVWPAYKLARESRRLDPDPLFQSNGRVPGMVAFRKR